METHEQYTGLTTAQAAAVRIVMGMIAERLPQQAAAPDEQRVAELVAEAVERQVDHNYLHESAVRAVADNFDYDDLSATVAERVRYDVNYSDVADRAVDAVVENVDPDDVAQRAAEQIVSEGKFSIADQVAQIVAERIVEAVRGALSAS